jgi:hypothetical protein
VPFYRFQDAEENPLLIQADDATAVIVCVTCSAFVKGGPSGAARHGTKPPRGAPMGVTALKLFDVGFLFTSGLDDSLPAAFC